MSVMCNIDWNTYECCIASLTPAATEIHIEVQPPTASVCKPKGLVCGIDIMPRF